MVFFPGIEDALTQAGEEEGQESELDSRHFDIALFLRSAQNVSQKKSALSASARSDSCRTSARSDSCRDTPMPRRTWALCSAALVLLLALDLTGECGSESVAVTAANVRLCGGAPPYMLLGRAAARTCRSCATLRSARHRADRNVAAAACCCARALNPGSAGLKGPNAE